MVREHRRARLNPRFDVESASSVYFVLDIEFISYQRRLMKFYIARKPTFESRSLILGLLRSVFLSKVDFLNFPIQ
ncbi:hypothetical protein EI981_10075 [Paenibacillus lutimineralis]|uniref:Uncharacterized protein n=1 Tax=Paenibacillus lutimineralis TaxID=2707005 RepID=A0A3Q9I7W2_9BACL|nr:hypothetical protein EI981_10075 [Paenibacillus lutimineralis]